MCGTFPPGWGSRRTVSKACAALAALLPAVAAGGCRPPENRLNGGGSSFVYPLMSKWAVTYARDHGVEVNYQSAGSGAGIRQLSVGTLDFGCTDVPLDDEQLRAARGEVVHVPLAMGAVVPAYHLPGVGPPVRFTGPVLADMFLGRITRWDDPRLRELNPDLPLPGLPIAPVHRSDGSGTTHVWADYLCKVSPDWKAAVGRGTSLRWPHGVGQKGNEGVAGYVIRTPGSVGYLELVYARQNDLQYGSVRNRAGAFVRASPEHVAAAAEATLAALPDDLRFSLTDAPGVNSYPVSGTVWAVFRADQPAGKGRRLVEFLRWATHEGQQHARDLQYTALPAGLVARVDEALARVRVRGDEP